MENDGKILEGTYHYKVTNFDGTFKNYSTPVIIVGETAKRFRIKLKIPIRNHLAGDCLWVLKKNVKIVRSYEPSEYWYNK